MTDLLECDLVMKGGITSGVVYPHAITTIAGKYRLRSIGGTSAGAIAAVMAAAAEYRRQTSPDKSSKAGFDKIRERGDELAENREGLEVLFQPSPELRPLFDLMMTAIGTKGNKMFAMLGASLKIFWGRLLIAFILALAGCALARQNGDCWVGIAGILSAILWYVASVACKLYSLINGAFSQNHFGLCPGTTQRADKQPALTEWMANTIQEVAGRASDARPLLAGDLKDHKIDIAAMTTDLSSGRPYQLPLKTNIHYFSKSEFEKIFPETIIKYLVGTQTPITVNTPSVPNDLYRLPSGDEMPVLLVARMSLSFPGLLQAVPLYRYDDELEKPPEDQSETAGWKIRKCLFSDGGISSNFPIHIFDAFLPGRPTLGISLAEYSEEHHDGVYVHLPDKAKTLSTALAVRAPKGALGFLMSIVNTAKDWQDTLQSKLQGSAERIVEIRLVSKEGGMNLKMKRKDIQRLIKLGEQAGEKLVNDFNFDEHRWRRSMAFATVMERHLDQMHENYQKAPQSGGLNYAGILTDYDPTGLKENSDTWRENVLKPFIEKLDTLGETQEEAEARRANGDKSHIKDGELPAMDARIRLIADADRIPKTHSSN